MQTGAVCFQPVAPCAGRRGCRVAAALPRASCFRAGPLRWDLVAPFALLGARGSRCTSRRPVVAQAADNKEGQQEKPVKYNTEFGYSRKDVILIGVGITALGYGMYYGLQATGMEPGIAGNFVQLIVILGISLGWVGTYLFRVANKQMTYVKQLEDYEEAVMAKRLQEMPEAEMERLLGEVEEEKARKAVARGKAQQ